MFIRLLPHRSFLRFLLPVAVFMFSAVAGISFAAWLDAPNAPPNYGIVGCTPPCLQEDFKPMNLGSTAQTKHSGATFEGNLTADNLYDTANYPTYFIDPAGAATAANLLGSLTINSGALNVTQPSPVGYAIYASGGINYFSGNVGIGTTGGLAKLVVNNPSTSGKTGSAGDAIYAYANNTNSAISAEQANAAGYAIYASGGINYFSGNVGIGIADPGAYALNVVGSVSADGLYDRQDTAYFIDPRATISSGNLSGTFTVGGNVGIGTTDTTTYRLNVAGNANATQLCIAGDCRSLWPSVPPETDPKVTGGSTGYLTKWTGATSLGNSAIYDNGSLIGIGMTNPTLAKLNVSGIAAGGSMGIYTTGSTYGLYTANKVRAGALCVGSDSECINSLVPRAYADGNGVWTWTQVVNNSIPDGYSMVWRQGSANLDSTRPVFGLRISGGSDDGGVCGAGVGGYFWGWVGRLATFTGYTYDVFGNSSGVLLGNNGAGAFNTGEWIFENIPPGRSGSSPVNKAAGVIFIPPGKTLYYWQIYNNGPGTGGNTCIVEALYGN